MMKPMRCPKLMTAVVAIGLFPSAVMADAARYELDAAHTTIAFMVEHVGYAKTLGQFTRASGGYTFDDETGTLSSLRVAVATDSVDTHHEARDEHLRSGEFLDVEEHPEMTFTAASARRTGDGTFAVAGELTLLGTTWPLTLEATVNKRAPYPFGDRVEVMGVSARGTLKRSEFGMTYGVADDLVGDEVEILIEIEARRAP
jgi:polyisoprenoid-binding protein YceI